MKHISFLIFKVGSYFFPLLKIRLTPLRRERLAFSLHRMKFYQVYSILTSRFFRFVLDTSPGNLPYLSYVCFGLCLFSYTIYILALEILWRKAFSFFKCFQICHFLPSTAMMLPKKHKFILHCKLMINLPAFSQWETPGTELGRGEWGRVHGGRCMPNEALITIQSGDTVLQSNVNKLF